ncbi:unnamed protein product [Schistosoma mattheei]|uniref:Uncharacterized protein n=2 Tax=Schistosoma TaxID=6181 RepID=A0A183L015_9TREM|nr:unnamed protein product [Schistosoma mattheei]VDP72973.1 unnamed protein product [Schistosoma curassoni]
MLGVFLNLHKCLSDDCKSGNQLSDCFQSNLRFFTGKLEQLKRVGRTGWGISL